MPSWEETKQAAQSVYNGVGNVYQDIYGSIGDTYQQFLTGGGISPGRTGLTQEIAENSWQVNPEYAEMERAYEAQEREAERDMTGTPPFEPQKDIEEPDI